MNKERVKFFRQLLSERLVRASDANNVQEAVETPLEMLPDQNDQASYDYDRNLGIRILDRERRLIHKIKQALERLDTGSYGLCEQCGEEIPEKRLVARPVTTVCVECKNESEHRERAFVQE
jgi:DnaK suppressor protein